MTVYRNRDGGGKKGEGGQEIAAQLVLARDTA